MIFNSARLFFLGWFMGLNFFSDAGSLFSMNALKDSWNNFKSKNQVSSSQLKFKELADYESVPDNELSLDGRYWKKKYNALAIIENDNQAKYSSLLERYEELDEKFTNERSEKIEILQEHAEFLKERSYLQQENEQLHNELNKLKKDLDKSYQTIQEQSDIIHGLADKLKKAEAKLMRDGTNSGIPTSLTPFNKTKVIPNCRKPTERNRGGQPNHERHILETPKHIDETVEYLDDAEYLICGRCGSNSIIQYGTKTIYEKTVKVKTVCREIHIGRYVCLNCGDTFDAVIPNHLYSNVTTQYGPEVKSFILSMLVYGNVAVNRTRELMRGITDCEIEPSNGYICKLIRQFAQELRIYGFENELKDYLINNNNNIVHWDDTVVSIDKKRACIRFTGNNNLALYTAHAKKNLAGILEDGILQCLSSDCVVVHDHNKVNYNKVFRFKNAECNQHLERDLITGELEFTNHSWVADMHHFFEETIHARNVIEESGGSCFSVQEISDIRNTYNNVLQTAEIQHTHAKNDKGEEWYWYKDETALINRLQCFGENYLLWIENFKIPTTNNLAERALRIFKTKMKISGQFFSVETAKDYALILSYTETCKRNGINPSVALQRLCLKQPYRISEVFPKPEPSPESQTLLKTVPPDGTSP